MRRERVKVTDHYRRLWRVTDALVAKLARTGGDGQGVDATAHLFHQSVEQLRQIEIQLAEAEQCK
jgi:hypothetical protein